MDKTKKPRPVDKDRTGPGQRRETQTTHFKSKGMINSEISQYHFTPHSPPPALITRELLFILAEIDSVKRIIHLLGKRDADISAFEKQVETLHQEMRDVLHNAIGTGD